MCRGDTMSGQSHVALWAAKISNRFEEERDTQWMLDPLWQARSSKNHTPKPKALNRQTRSPKAKEPLRNLALNLKPAPDPIRGGSWDLLLLRPGLTTLLMIPKNGRTSLIPGSRLKSGKSGYTPFYTSLLSPMNLQVPPPRMRHPKTLNPEPCAPPERRTTDCPPGAKTACAGSGA